MQKCTAPGCGLRGLYPASGDAKSTGAPDRDAPNAKIKCVITRACRACFSSNAAWALAFEVAASARYRVGASLVSVLFFMPHHHHAPTYRRTNVPTYHRIVASVARLLRANGRDRPEIRAVVAHGVITGTFKNGT